MGGPQRRRPPGFGHVGGHAGLIARWSTRREPVDGLLRVWASDLRPDELQRFSFVLHSAGLREGSAPVTMRQIGEHHVGNALATATAALALGLDLVGVADALSRATARSRWRMELVERADGLAVLNDAYNANPDRCQPRWGRYPVAPTVADRRAGDMLELGGRPRRTRRIGGSPGIQVDLIYATGRWGGTSGRFYRGGWDGALVCQ